MKYVYFFGEGVSEGNSSMKNLLGGKGSNLAEMANLGIPVPAGFTISTEVCTAYYKNNEKYPAELRGEVDKNMRKAEEVMKAKFGDSENPLLVSVRSGARVSMPGMMDTVLNIGLNDATIKGFASAIGSERTAYDSYRRFVQMYGNVVLGVEDKHFFALLDEAKEKKGVKQDTELDENDLRELTVKFKQVIKEKGKTFPEEPIEQLWGAIGAVFMSWNISRAISYRKLNNIPNDWGTAVNVQAMVFGNTGENSATGVAFTRDPATGENAFYGEYLMNAQGEDVVAGIRTPLALSSLKNEMPQIYENLAQIREKLEKNYRDMQDIEFTIQRGKLWMLQTRTGKRTALSSIRIAVELMEEGVISKEEAVSRIEPDQLDQLLHPMFDPKAEKKVIAKGLNASPGASSGMVILDSEEAASIAKEGKKVILVRQETSPEDINGMAASQGILTARGGMTSHAAVVARGMGKCCVAGCSAINVSYESQSFSARDITVKKGDYISLDGSTGEVMLGEVATMSSEITQVLSGAIKVEDSKVYGYYSKIMSWANEIKKLGVRANADTPPDAKIARGFGAEGIGLTRTEHMFFGETRLPIVQKMILSKTKKEREGACDELLPMQREDFRGILEAMDGLPVIIRLLDPPLHEFLPKHEEVSLEIARLKVEKADEKIIKQKQDLLKNIESLAEMNPMLGHRGCRLGITFPEVYRMQARAIFEAASELTKKGLHPEPEVMIPLVGDVNELAITKKDVVEVANEVMSETGVKIKCIVGTMIELPRAAITADEIAKEAEFFSYGTNDLTQTTFGFSRDDVEGKFLAFYVGNQVLKVNPFEVLDQRGVGELVKMGIEKGRSTRPDLEVGICGEHGGEPSSVEFCHRVGMNYVSCSPFRVPIACLAAAQAVLKEKP